MSSKTNEIQKEQADSYCRFLPKVAYIWPSPSDSSTGLYEALATIGGLAVFIHAFGLLLKSTPTRNSCIKQHLRRTVDSRYVR
ncbi:unnamed protein product [Rodentolepis nana]|uniref:Dolichyl-diphosphooligosaccharide--protein glycosyltransferase subunit DAD1 n=1 Tax=Rodentolepis nana TaxID=102285 RepID=A0A0R3TR30_RODNA|nr:unnamed protein product [Rodentolepis nana]